MNTKNFIVILLIFSIESIFGISYKNFYQKMTKPFLVKILKNPISSIAFCAGVIGSSLSCMKIYKCWFIEVTEEDKKNIGRYKTMKEKYEKIHLLSYCASLHKDIFPEVAPYQEKKIFENAKVTIHSKNLYDYLDVRNTKMSFEDCKEFFINSCNASMKNDYTASFTMIPEKLYEKIHEIFFSMNFISEIKEQFKQENININNAKKDWEVFSWCADFNCSSLKKMTLIIDQAKKIADQKYFYIDKIDEYQKNNRSDLKINFQLILSMLFLSFHFFVLMSIKWFMLFRYYLNSSLFF